jgi:hypothetical protein
MDIELSADYGEQRDKEAKQATVNENVQHLDITGLPIQVAVRDINLVTNDTYIMLRRHSLGASDSSVVLGCNPFKNREELIAEKIAKEVTAEERAIGEKIAVRKGRDLEPLILEKFKKVFLQEIIKPSDMYVFKDYPFLSINFDGVTGEPGHYTPAEIKVVTMYGEKHYDFSKAIYNEQFKTFFPTSTISTTLHLLPHQ